MALINGSFSIAFYLPLVKPGLAVLAILSFNFHWNEFFRPLIFLIDNENFPITLGIFQLQGYMMTGSIAVCLGRCGDVTGASHHHISLGATLLD